MAYIFGSIWDRFNRNALNDLSKNVETQGKSIQDLVAEGQLTEEQYANLITVINGFVKSGEIDKYDLTTEMRAEIEKINDKANKSYVDTVLSEKRDKTYKVVSEDLSQEVLELISGGTVNLNTVPQDDSVSGAKLQRNYNFKQTLTSEDLNTVLDSGIYYTETALPNKPEGTSEKAIIKVDRVGGTGSYVIQEYADVTPPSPVYRRVIRIGYTTRSWYKVNMGDLTVDGGDIIDGTIKSSGLSENYNHRGTVTESEDLNDVVKAGFYVIAGTASNMPAGLNAGLLTVESSIGFVTQMVQSVEGNRNKSYKRVIRPGSELYYDWFPLHSESQTGLSGKKVIQFGDSIYGNKRPPNDISTAFAERTGANAFNAGLGGARMAQHAQYWDATSMYRLADAIATGDWSLQDEMKTAYDAGQINGLPYYVPDVIEDLKATDFNTVDLITIAYGTNDFATNDVTAVNENDPLDTTTYAGALRYSIRTLSEAYPHIKIVVISPMYRFWTEGSQPYDFLYDSDTHTNNGELLTDYVELAEKVSKEEKVEYIDAYHNFGINKYNRHYYFDDLLVGGGVHHNVQGGQYIGEKLGSIISSKF